MNFFDLGLYFGIIAVNIINIDEKSLHSCWKMRGFSPI